MKYPQKTDEHPSFVLFHYATTCFSCMAILRTFAEMPIEVLSIVDFLGKRESGQIPVIDTRSESEFSHARIPGAFNIPLLNNDERVVIGTLYKQKGREEAVIKGFELVGPRFHEIIRKALEISPDKKVLMYCWRGGMRSNIMAWVLSMSGFEVLLLKGGYKSFRNYVLETIKTPKKVIVLGGPTGSGKTDLLLQLKNDGEQALDLEGLANHKGSAFGALGLPPQPSNEQFENLIALQWSKFNNHQPVWIENESRSVGSCMVPDGIFFQVRDSTVINIQVPHSLRVKRITDEYGRFPVDVLAATSKKIEKRLGPQHLKAALEHLYSGNFNEWLAIILNYYDKLYNYGNTQRDPSKIHQLDLTVFEESEYISVLKRTATEIFNSEEKIESL